MNITDGKRERSGLLLYGPAQRNKGRRVYDRLRKRSLRQRTRYLERWPERADYIEMWHAAYVEGVRDSITNMMEDE